MTLRLGALHDALLDPGNAEKAKIAAEELANYDNRLTTLDTKLTVLTWMVATLVLLTMGHLWLTFTILSRLR